MNNPIRFIDPNGKTGWDIVKGAMAAISDNYTGGVLKYRENNSYVDGSDYNLGQDIGDAISIVIGVGEVIGGGSATVVGVAGAPETLGASLAVSKAGVALSTHGSIMTGTAAANLMSQKGRVDGNKKGPKNLVDEAKQSQAKRDIAKERQSKRKAQTQRGNSRTGNSNKDVRGSHHKNTNGNKDYYKANARRAREQKKADEKNNR